MKAYLRNAEPKDLDLLYIWANDSEVRNNSFNAEPILYERHVEWFNNIMVDNTVLQFIMMIDDIPVGQIRLNIDGDEAEIGYSISREFRGKGYGRIILQLVFNMVAKEYPQIKKLIANVKPENTVSAKLFQSEGYDLQYFRYVKILG